MKQSFTVIANFVHRLTSLLCQKSNRSIVILRKRLLMDFRKVIYENVKKNIHFTTKILYIYGSQKF